MHQTFWEQWTNMSSRQLDNVATPTLIMPNTACPATGNIKLSPSSWFSPMHTVFLLFDGTKRWLEVEADAQKDRRKHFLFLTSWCVFQTLIEIGHQSSGVSLDLQGVHTPKFETQFEPMNPGSWWNVWGAVSCFRPHSHEWPSYYHSYCFIYTGYYSRRMENNSLYRLL